jgi:hypothetical protein
MNYQSHSFKFTNIIIHYIQASSIMPCMNHLQLLSFY